MSRYYYPVLEKSVGEIIKKLRKEKNITQELLAEKIDSHQVYISEIENGKKLPSLEVLMQIAYAFKMTLTNLISLIEENYNCR